jgi:hypothetical protein
MRTSRILLGFLVFLAVGLYAFDDKLSKRVEQQGVLIRRGDWLVSGPPQFREDPTELRVGCRTEAVPDACIEHGVIAAERIDPRMERQYLFCFMAAPNQDARPSGDRLPDKFPKQSALADTGLAPDQYHASASIKHFCESVVQAAEFEIAADHRCFLSPSVYVSTRGRRSPSRTVRTGTGATQDIAV